MKKKVTALVLTCVMLMGCFAGCGGSGGNGGNGGGSGGGDGTYSFRLATHYAVTHPGYAALQRICDDLKEKSGGAIEITIYPSSQLGDYTLTYEDLMRGAVDMALIPIPSEYDPKLEMNFIPYMVTDYSQMKDAFGADSYFFQEYSKVHDALGVKLLGIYVEGLIGIGFTDLPKNYADAAAAKGDQIRCPAIEVYNLVTEDMGFSATTIAYADLYTALQTGVVDGWIGGTPQLNYTDFKDVINYYVAYNMFAENIGFFMSKDIFEGLPEEYQTMIEDAFMKEAVNSYETAQQLDQEALDGLKDYGIEIITLTNDEMNAYITSIQEKTWPKLYKNIGEDTMNKLIDDLNK